MPPDLHDTTLSKIFFFSAQAVVAFEINITEVFHGKKPTSDLLCSLYGLRKQHGRHHPVGSQQGFCFRVLSTNLASVCSSVQLDKVLRGFLIDLKFLFVSPRRCIFITLSVPVLRSFVFMKIYKPWTSQLIKPNIVIIWSLTQTALAFTRLLW